MILAATALAGQITTSFSLSPDDVQFMDYEGRDAMELRNAFPVLDEGYPALLGMGRAFVLPQGAALTDVEVKILETVELEGTFDLVPVRPVPIGQIPGPFTESVVYYQDSFYPTEPIIDFHTGSKTGFRIGSFTYLPFSYNPTSGKIRMITEAEVTCSYRIDPSVRLLRLTEQQVDIALNGLEGIVANPEMLSSYAPVIREGGTDWSSWVCIADPDLQSNLQPLVDHRDQTAGSAEFVSLDWIKSNYSGYDTQEKIRNYLKEAFEDHGLVYCLIVGDFGETNRLSSLRVGGSTMNTTTDLYYSDLDGTWDADGDHRYGENTDELDYYSDIYVGRFSGDYSTWIDPMVDKTLDYEGGQATGSWKTEALLCGAVLWPEYSYTGSKLCNELCSIIPTGWTEHKLYESLGGSHPNNQIQLMNEGASLVEPTGHGYQNGVFWYYSPTNMFTSANYTDLTNIDKLSVMHSIACLSGQLKSAGSISERMMFWSSGGTIANFFNSSYGWGSPPSFGPSEWLEIWFYRQMFWENDYELGVTQALAKDAFKASGGMTYQHWVLQENNMLGDPATMFISAQTGLSEEGESQVSGGPVLHHPSPNPAVTICSIGYAAPGSSQATIEVFDMAGRMVRTVHEGTLPSVEGSFSFDVTDLAPGCYTILMRTEDASVSQSMIVLD
jgi:hypothetical protein